MVPADVALEWKRIARARYPHEAIFAYWPDGSWRELANCHPAPKHAFKVGGDDLKLVTRRKPALLVHTHCQGNASPSELDSVQQIKMGIPWGIMLVDGGEADHAAHDIEWFGKAAPHAPLIGRTYLWGVRDCFTLVQAWFALQGIDIPCVPRFDPGPQVFPLLIPKAGFRPIASHQVEPGDVVVMELSHSFPDHCAVYLGEGRYLEHVSGRNSEIKFHRTDVLARRNAAYYRLKDSNAQDRTRWRFDPPFSQPV